MLIDYFSKIEDPTVIVFFGDHQPNDTVAAPILNLNGMTTKTLTEDQLKLRYEVPYVIWANYDIQEETVEKTSLNYLYSILADRLGFPMTGCRNF